MNTLVRQGLWKADEVRSQLGVDMFQPMNVFDACITLGLTVRFVDINMEGMYIKQESGKFPTILLSNQRPLPRRCFTCAHELGHHVFDHGSRIDPLFDQALKQANRNSEEVLVDVFAGALLMPVAGVQAELANRNWISQKCSPVQFYILSSIFGTGYQTLIVHCKVNGIISETKAESLLKYTPAKILKDIFKSGNNKSHFKIIDGQSSLSTIDLEVSNYIILPPNLNIEGNHLEKYQKTALGSGYVAVKPGIVRASASDNSINYFIRIQNSNYIGLVENRHLETETN